jgi:hypothetical protein
MSVEKHDQCHKNTKKKHDQGNYKKTPIEEHDQSNYKKHQHKNMTKAMERTNMLKNDDYHHHECHHHVDTTIEEFFFEMVKVKKH